MTEEEAAGKAGAMRIFAGILCFVLLITSGACNSMRQDDQGGGAANRSGGSATGARQGNSRGTLITGTVRHIALEGGFYGIETDDGTKLDPVNLPEDFRKDGLRVRMRVERLEGRVSFHMWGSLVRILSIERL